MGFQKALALYIEVRYDDGCFYLVIGNWTVHVSRPLINVRFAILMKGAAEATEGAPLLLALIASLLAAKLQRTPVIVVVQMSHEFSCYIRLAALPTDILLLRN